MKVIHSWLKEYVGDTLPDSQKVEELLTFHAFEVDGVEEVEGETVIDVKILPDRGSDCLSHRGVARELATILNVELKHDPLRQQIDLPVTDSVLINIQSSKACPRFTTSVITGVTVKESPEWLKKRLRVLGQRPINNIVDATNYVMLALGQPIHAYDADKFPLVDGKWMLGIRFATEGETVSLLAEAGKDEDRVVELTGSELLIVEGSKDTPVGLAGIKGGRYAELHPGTKNIIIEAAHFDPAVIRKTARRLGILTEASKRFENEPARDLPLYAQQEIIKLITDIAGGTCVGLVDEYKEKQTVTPVRVSPERINALLGLTLEPSEIIQLTERTGSSVVEEGEGLFSVTPPWERTDLLIEANFVEEVGRIHGLSKIKSVIPVPVPVTEVNARQYYTDKIRQALIEQGFSEVITTSFQKKGKLQLQNALASDKTYLRDSLIKNISSVLDANYAHIDLLGLSEVRVFEIGTVFSKTKTSVTEHVSLALGVRTKGNGYNQKDDVILEAGRQAVSHTLGIEIAWENDKGVAETNLTDVLEKLPTPRSYEPITKQIPVTYQAVSPYPAVARDIALWVAGGESTAAVAATLTTAAGPLLVRHTLFDTFTKDGRTSYAFRLVFQAKDRTLTDIEVNAVMENIYLIAAAQKWEVR